MEVAAVTSQMWVSTTVTPATAALAATVPMALAALAVAAETAVTLEARLAGRPLAATAALEFYFTRVAISHASGDS
jgi:hypothetical protein